MQNYQYTDVYQYLNSLYDYLTGDLKEFHKICQEIEQKESNTNYVMTASNAVGIASPITSSFSQSPTLTTETTQNPNFFQHISSFDTTSIVQKYYRLTIPVTLSLFAAIDCLGYLAGSNNDSTKTFKNFREFFKISPIVVTESECDFINQVFRQGLSHIYFPKLNLGISYHSNNPPNKLIFKSNNSFLILNVNRLEEIVKNTFEIIKDDASLYSKMESRYQALVQKYTAEYGLLISNYIV